jgi:glycosyltransferase involved in cell wall biosynthesis
MVCGLPCVVTDVGGNAAFVGEGGIIVEPNDPRGVRTAIRELANDSALRRVLGRAALHRSVTLLSGDDTLSEMDPREEETPR